ncbi:MULTISPECIES: hypothetical protein [unclassified Thalassospira]|uniref:hypothetical protein n=1 Tax=unclassified Thalassospira TaxID=2648997 RepID=UPI00117D3799|nr:MULTISPECIES: hypothetical protein [unclassified Thalassospira]
MAGTDSQDRAGRQKRASRTCSFCCLDGNKPESYAAHMPASIDDVSSVINVICVLRFAKVTNPLNIMMSLYGFPV